MPTSVPSHVRIRDWIRSTLLSPNKKPRYNADGSLDLILLTDNALVSLGLKDGPMSRPRPDHRLEVLGAVLEVHQEATYQQRRDDGYRFLEDAHGGDLAGLFEELDRDPRAWLPGLGELLASGAFIDSELWGLAGRWLAGTRPLTYRRRVVDIGDPVRVRAAGAVAVRLFPSVVDGYLIQTGEPYLHHVAAALASIQARTAPRPSEELEEEDNAEAANAVVELVHEIDQAVQTLGEDLDDAPPPVRVLQARLRAAVDGYRHELIGAEPNPLAPDIVRACTTGKLWALLQAGIAELEIRGEDVREGGLARLLDDCPRTRPSPQALELERAGKALRALYWDRIGREETSETGELGVSAVSLNLAGGRRVQRAIADGEG